MSRNSTIVLPRAEHTVSRKSIDPACLKVLRRLNESGYAAYLVGGAVRDLLLGRTPKDFDVATDAHPNEIKRLFRNAFLIGRRFRLAHIRFGKTIIETSTFRRRPDSVTSESNGARHENTFGTAIEDAFRRDFTVNGLFYNIADFSVIDHVGGLRDLRKRLVRSIGEPDERLVEDPVRMIRAVRFAAKLGFSIERRTASAIERHSAHLCNQPAARMFEELVRLLSNGATRATFRLLWEMNLLEPLFPGIDLNRYLRKNGKKKAPMFAYLDRLDVCPDADVALRLAVLLHDPLTVAAARAGESADSAFLHAAHESFNPIAHRYALPRKVVSRFFHILGCQRLLSSDPNRTPDRALAWQPCFPDALALHGIVCSVSGTPFHREDEWRCLCAERATDADSEPMDGAPLEADDDKPRRGRRKRRFSRRKSRARPPHNRDRHVSDKNTARFDMPYQRRIPTP